MDLERDERLTIIFLLGGRSVNIGYFAQRYLTITNIIRVQIISNSEGRAASSTALYASRNRGGTRLFSINSAAVVIKMGVFELLTGF